MFVYDNRCVVIFFFVLFSVTMLSASQLEYRKRGAFKCQFEYIENKNSHIPSFMKFVYKNFIVNMSKKLKVDESIIDFNLTRLDEVTIQSVLLNCNTNQKNLNHAYRMQEWPIALEIFLQIDGKQNSILTYIFFFFFFFQ
jgi:hypothetical protein